MKVNPRTFPTSTISRTSNIFANLHITVGEKVDLSSLRTVTSTGSVLGTDVCKWFYDNGFPKAVHLVSCSGGTDMACSREFRSQSSCIRYLILRASFIYTQAHIYH